MPTLYDVHEKQLPFAWFTIRSWKEFKVFLLLPLNFPIFIQLPFSRVDATFILATESAILAPSLEKKRNISASVHRST